MGLACSGGEDPEPGSGSVLPGPSAPGTFRLELSRWHVTAAGAEVHPAVVLERLATERGFDLEGDLDAFPLESFRLDRAPLEELLELVLADRHIQLDYRPGVRASC